MGLFLNSLAPCIQSMLQFFSQEQNWAWRHQSFSMLLYLGFSPFFWTGSPYITVSTLVLTMQHGLELMTILLSQHPTQGLRCTPPHPEMPVLSVHCVKVFKPTSTSCSIHEACAYTVHCGSCSPVLPCLLMNRQFVRQSRAFTRVSIQNGVS